MSENDYPSKDQLKKYCRKIYKALTGLTDLHVWPANRDVAELEDQLHEQLDVLNYQLSMDGYDLILPEVYGPFIDYLPEPCPRGMCLFRDQLGATRACR